jgi:hypothetical protein
VLSKLGLHLTRTHPEKNQAKLYLKTHPEATNQCAYCSEPTKYRNWSEGFNKYCSRSCSITNNWNSGSYEDREENYTDEQRRARSKRFSKLMIKLHQDPEFKKKRSEVSRRTMVKLHQDPEFRETVARAASETFTRLNKDPEFRRKSREATQKRVTHVNVKAGEGGSNLPAYYIWNSMVRRCYVKKHHAYHRYGGRGIRVCKEWLGENGVYMFQIWCLSQKNYGREGYSLDRINNSKGYSPKNCRFASKKTQANNRG